MKMIAVLEADFDTSPIGTRSRLADDLSGIPVLRRTVERLLRCTKLTRIFVTTSPAHRSQAETILAGLNVSIETHEAGPTPWRAFIRSSRKWSLDGWRGGLGDTTVFDESMHIWVLNALAEREAADGVVSIPAAAALIDPILLDKMIDHYDGVREDMRLTFTQSAPGLSGFICTPDLLAQLVKLNQPAGRLLAYTPSEPRPDMLTKPCFYPVADTIAHAWGRCIADTQASFDRLAHLLSLHKESTLDATTVSQELITGAYETEEQLPQEVEIELTTADPLPNSTLRPRGDATGARGPMDLGLFQRLLAELATRDDMRIVLGGFGDPLLHPQWPDVLAACRKAGIFAVAVRTTAVTLDEQAANLLAQHQVDALNVLIDATTAETYRNVHNADQLDCVLANLERLAAVQQQRQQPQPIVVAEMMKTVATRDEMEPFYDHWLNRTGTAVISGPSHYARQWPDLSIMSMTPPTRRPCSRIFTRAMVLADGTVTVCDQDFKGNHAAGTLAESTLSELWKGPRMTGIRASHLAGLFDAMPLCADCDEWHRP